ncbi:unnamed protein product [Caenorhabditis brenneri]
MKSIVWTLIVFMISSSIVAQSTDEPDISPEEFLAQVNEIRREFAKNRSISNMHELTWDTNLVQELIKDVEKDGDVNDNTHADVGYTKLYKQLLVDIDVEIPNLVAFLKGENPTNELDNDSFFLCPLHVKIGCNFFETLQEKRCYMSPKQNQLDKLTYQEVGSPGSKCNDGYANNDGLCSLIGSFTTEAPPTTPEKP